MTQTPKPEDDPNERIISVVRGGGGRGGGTVMRFGACPKCGSTDAAFRAFVWYEALPSSLLPPEFVACRHGWHADPAKPWTDEDFRL